MRVIYNYHANYHACYFEASFLGRKRKERKPRLHRINVLLRIAAACVIALPFLLCEAWLREDEWAPPKSSHSLPRIDLFNAAHHRAMGTPSQGSNQSLVVG